MLARFWSFLREEFSHRSILSNLMWTAIFAVLAVFWDKFSTNAPWTKWAIGVIATFAVIRLISSLTARPKTHPHLSLELLDFRYVAAGGGKAIAAPDGTMMLLTVAVLNRGEPSVAFAWGMRMTLPGAPAPIYPQLVGIGDEPLQMKFGDDRSPRANITADLTLYEKVENRPVPKGGRVTGFVIFLVREISPEQLAPGTQMRLRCCDIDGKEVALDFVMSGRGENTNTYVAGISHGFTTSRSSPSAAES